MIRTVVHILLALLSVVCFTLWLGRGAANTDVMSLFGGEGDTVFVHQFRWSGESGLTLAASREAVAMSVGHLPATWPDRPWPDGFELAILEHVTMAATGERGGCFGRLGSQSATSYGEMYAQTLHSALCGQGKTSRSNYGYLVAAYQGIGAVWFGGAVTQTSNWGVLMLRAPLWLLAIVCGVFPIVSFFRGPLRRWRRQRRGLCMRCGYDLRGSETGACPECGAAR